MIEKDTFHLEIAEILNSMEEISLEAASNVSLLNRIDTKFCAPIELIPPVLNQARENYLVLDINGIKHQVYENIYFDDSNLSTYHWHLFRRLNRYKLRLRKYANTSGLTFFEVKIRTNKNRIVKKRLRCEWTPCLHIASHNEIKNFVAKYNFRNLVLEDIHPVIFMSYKRITLISKEANERITIDTDLSFQSGEKNFSFSRAVFIEVKREGNLTHSHCLKMLKNMKVREGGMSKYCTGMVILNPSLKKNNFMPVLRHYMKIERNGSLSYADC